MSKGRQTNGKAEGTNARTQLESVSVANACSVSDIRSSLDRLYTEQGSVTSLLEASIADYDNVLRQIRRLDQLRSRLEPVATHARALIEDKLADAALTASQISGAVERLDLEQARVKATLEVVDEVAELKACILGVNGSMGAPQDWETAAEYLYRASKVSENVINSGFAEQIVPTAEVPDAPRITLDNASQSLCELFLREFDKAIQQSDGARITRFFKMFPLIGRSEEGLSAYGKYVCQGVAARARTSLQASRRSLPAGGSPYVGALTKLFEHIAQVIDGHSTLVERHYGKGTMIRVIERLHAEASVQGGIILDTWSEERNVERKLTDVKSYAFSFLVQSFLPPQRGIVSASRSQSPSVGTSANYQRVEKEDGIDTKEVDDLLGDMVTMLGRWSLYLKFISSRVADYDDAEHEDSDLYVLSSPSFIINSSLPRKISKLLVEPFNTLATFYLRRSVEKAFQLDEAPTGLSLSTSVSVDANEPLITSAVDDVMFIVNQVIQRTLATSHASLVVDVISTVARVLGSDFIGMIQRKMRDESYPKAAIQGASPPEDKVIAFFILLNNLDVSMAYMKRIVRTHTDEVNTDTGDIKHSNGLSDLFPMNRDASKIHRVLVALEQNFDSKASDLIGDGVSVAFLHVIKSRLRPILADTFREIDNSISEEPDSLHKAEEPDDEVDQSKLGTVKHRFQSGWDNLMGPVKRILSNHNFERVLATSISYLTKTLEKRIWNYQGRVSDMGAVRLERDITDIANVAVRGGNFKLRESFNKCLQIVMIMNMDEEEWEDLEPSIDSAKRDDNTSWELDLIERQRARTLIRRKL